VPVCIARGSSCNNYAVSDHDDSVATLVHAFVADRVDYCVGLLAGSLAADDSQAATCYQRSCASRVIPRLHNEADSTSWLDQCSTSWLVEPASSCKRGIKLPLYVRGLTHFRRHVLHWLGVTDRIRFRLCVQVYKCQHSMAPGYPVDLCRPVSSIDSHKHLRSANRGQPQIPRIRLSAYGRRAFGHAGASTWNVLSNILKCSTHPLPTFKQFYFSFYQRTEHVRRYYS